MSFFRQLWALTLKNLLLVLIRKPFTTLGRALILPVLYVFVISYSKNFVFPATGYGVGTPAPVLSLSDAFNSVGNQRNKVVVVDNGFKDGDIGEVVSSLSKIVLSHGREFHVVEKPSSLTQLCPASILGVTSCFGGVIFESSPDHGEDTNLWQYTLAGDESLGVINVKTGRNGDQLYTLPFQRAIDSAIALTHGGSPLPDDILQYAFTLETEQEIQGDVNIKFQSILRAYLAFAFFVGISGITYHLAGHMALEREKGMSQLIEVMMPNRNRWEPQVARLLSYHLSFDMLYGPSWIILAAIIHTLVFPASNIGIIIGMHVLIGLSLTSYTIFAASFFRTAQLSGIIVIGTSLILAIAAQYGLIGKVHAPVAIVTSILFPPVTYMFFFFDMILFQAQDLPVNLSLLLHGMQLTGGTLMGIMVAQIFFFMILALFLERWIHSPSPKGRSVVFDAADEKSFAVRTRNFSKYYYPTSAWKRIFCCMCGAERKVVKAVNDLSLDLTPGSITVLLGANGSGKSTTLNAISGVDSITSGTIDIQGQGGLGLCPQKNVMWDELTVYEHVMIFDLLKRTGNSQGEDRRQLINTCDLGAKADSKAKTLSGGQKRKLQLSMMLVGGSRVCCIDEVSSGIDPLARRRIWDILLAERGRRSILLTTHFLDEADILSDHIVILSKGSMRAQGSSAELKHAYGSGYRIAVSEHFATLPASLMRLPNHKDGTHTIFQVPNSTAVSKFVRILESQGILNYQIQGPTIEEVFLKIADEMKDETPVFISNLGNSKNVYERDNPDRRLLSNSASINEPLDLTTGTGINYFRQMWILLRKRFTILRSSYMPCIVAVSLPVAAAGLVTMFFKTFAPNGLPCNDDRLITGSFKFPFFPYYFLQGFVFGPPDRIPLETLDNLFGNGKALNRLASELNRIPLVDTLTAFNAYVSSNQGRLGLGGIFLSADRPIFVWMSGGPGQSLYPAFVQNLMHNALMDQSIKIKYQPFVGGVPPTSGQSLQLIIYTALAFSAYPGLLALYPTIERLRNVRALHYSNGIRSTSLWSAYILFDFGFIALISVLAIALWVSLWHGWYNIGYVFVVFVLFGLASTAFSYCVSLFAWSQLSAFAFSAGFQCGTLMIYYAGYLITQAFASPDTINGLISLQFFTIGLIAPSLSLLRALLLTLNEFSLLCRGKSTVSSPGALDVYGGPILYLTVQFLLLMAFVMYWDEGRRFVLFRRSPRHLDLAEDLEGETKPHGAVKTPLRPDWSSDGLLVSHLSKSFGSNKAVDDISFDISPSEAFALLGPNGAGKSTLISLIRGDIRQSGHDGSVHIHGTPLFQHRAEARSHLGTCPQFDAIDLMSVIEHLRFYARARGVPNVEKNVARVMDAVGLTPYQRRTAWALSGGNKRKLSLAIALVGNPAVLILDEPSSGLDAASKRVMWKTLKSLSQGRVLVITTHSMEEADVLCQRAGIMAGRMLALGTTEELRKQYSNACYVHLVHKDAPHTIQQDMDRMRHWIQLHMPQAQVESRTYGGQLRFSVRNGSPMLVTDRINQQSLLGSEQDAWRECSTGSIFQFLESSRADLGYEHYSVSPATLDQVFLSVVNRHAVEEENYAAQRDKKKDKRKKVLGLF